MPYVKTGEEIGIFWSEIGVRIWRTGRHTPHQEFPGVPPSNLVNYRPVVSFVYTSLQARQIQKNYSRERFYKDAISENGFTGVRVDGKPIYVRSMGSHKYLDSCGRDQLISGTNHSL